jgi:hypothetical protein
MSIPRVTKDTVRSLADAVEGRQCGNVRLDMIQTGAQLGKESPDYSTTAKHFTGPLSTRRSAAYLLGAFNGWAWRTAQTIPEHVSRWNDQLANDHRFRVTNALYYGWRDGMDRAETYANSTGPAGLAPAELFYDMARLHRELIHATESKVTYIKARGAATDDSEDLVGAATMINYSVSEGRLILRRANGSGLHIDVRQVLRVY